MKRAALVFAVLSVLVIADGIYLELANNQQGCGCNGDSGALFGGGISISTGAEVLIGGVLLLIATGLFWIMSLLRSRGGLAAAANGRAQASPAQASLAQASPAQAGQSQTASAQAGQAQAANAQVGQSPAKTDAAAGPSQVAKETGDQLH